MLPSFSELKCEGRGMGWVIMQAGCDECCHPDPRGERQESAIFKACRKWDSEKLEAVCLSDMLVSTYKTAQRHNQKRRNLKSHLRENFETSIRSIKLHSPGLGILAKSVI
jgi:hypothetical protein